MNHTAVQTPTNIYRGVEPVWHCPICSKYGLRHPVSQQRLLDRIQELEMILEDRPTAAPLNFLNLTRIERTVVLFLMGAKSGATKENLFTHIYGLRAECDQPDIKVIDVFVCKIRRKLKTIDIDLQTVWGHGYRFAEKDRSKLRDHIKSVSGEKAEAA